MKSLSIQELQTVCGRCVRKATEDGKPGGTEHVEGDARLELVRHGKDAQHEVLGRRHQETWLP